MNMNDLQVDLAQDGDPLKAVDPRFLDMAIT